MRSLNILSFLSRDLDDNGVGRVKFSSRVRMSCLVRVLSRCPG